MRTCLYSWLHSDVLLRPRFGIASLKPEMRWDLSGNCLKSSGPEALAGNCSLEINSSKAPMAQERLLSFLPSAPCGFFPCDFHAHTPQYLGFVPPHVRANGSTGMLLEMRQARSAPVILSDPNVAHKLWQGLGFGIKGGCCAVFCSALKWLGFFLDALQTRAGWKGS